MENGRQIVRYVYKVQVFSRTILASINSQSYRCVIVARGCDRHLLAALVGRCCLRVWSVPIRPAGKGWIVVCASVTKGP